MIIYVHERIKHRLKYFLIKHQIEISIQIVYYISTSCITMHYNSIRIGLFFIYTTKIVTCDASKYIMGLINFLGSEYMDDSIKNYVIHFSALLNVLFTCLFTKNEYYLYLKKYFPHHYLFLNPHLGYLANYVSHATVMSHGLLDLSRFTYLRT